MLLYLKFIYKGYYINNNLRKKNEYANEYANVSEFANQIRKIWVKVEETLVDLQGKQEEIIHLEMRNL